MAQYEWIIIEVLVVGLLFWELYRVRRDIRRAKQQEAATANLPPAPTPAPALAPAPASTSTNEP